jgi:hypothetical protein
MPECPAATLTPLKLGNAPIGVSGAPENPPLLHQRHPSGTKFGPCRRDGLKMSPSSAPMFAVPVMGLS